jgi:hypothetical protein
MNIAGSNTLACLKPIKVLLLVPHGHWRSTTTIVRKLLSMERFQFIRFPTCLWSEILLLIWATSTNNTRAFDHGWSWPQNKWPHPERYYRLRNNERNSMVCTSAFCARAALQAALPTGGVRVVWKIIWVLQCSCKHIAGSPILGIPRERSVWNNSQRDPSSCTSATLLWIVQRHVPSTWIQVS